ncbi:hypothetical protein V496_02889 [Pseudogymnoascus sp. VKM F-4515 (FW-2607)]|nr:hypothetical protein V496_02889 [Pseudogymnoascus sp. VKM F-4515 (FW-2607)]
MDPPELAAPHPPVGGHETDSSITTTSPAAPAAPPIPTAGAPIVISPPSPPTTPIAIMSDAGGPPWPRPPTPGPGPTLPDRIFSFDGGDTPPHTPIAGPSFPQQPLSAYSFTNNHSNLPASHPVTDSMPNPTPGIFEPPKKLSQVSRPVLRLRPETGEGEGRDESERYGAMGSIDEIVNSGGFEMGDPAGEDFYADTDAGSGSETSSLSSLWASRAYLDRGSGDVGEILRIGEHEHERHTNGEGAGKVSEKGKRKADECAYCDPGLDPQHGGYFSDSGTATGDEAALRAGPFVPSFHDSQAAPVKRGSFVFRKGYGVEDEDMHERGGDGEDKVRVPVGCQLEFPMAPGGSDNQHSSDRSERYAPRRLEREIHRLPPPAPVCIRRPPTTNTPNRGRRLYRTNSPESTPDPSVIQLLTPQDTIGAQFNDVADVQVATEIGLLGGGYNMREIRSNGGCDEIRRGWGGVKGCVIEFKGGDKLELNLKEREAELAKGVKRRRDSPSGFYDGDDEGTIGAASDAEDAVAQLNSQSANLDFVLGPGEARPYILDVIYDDPNKAVSRYTDVADYSVHLQDAEKGNSFMVRLRDMRGSLVIMWKRVYRVEIVRVGGVVIEINAGDGRGSEGDDGEVVVSKDIELRGGAGKDSGGLPSPEKSPGNVKSDKGAERASTDSSPDAEASGSGRHVDSPLESGFPRVGSLYSSEDGSGLETPNKTRLEKGKGKAVDNGDTTPQNHYYSDSESHGSIPLFYEIPADYTQTLGPPHRIENPEPDYILGSCPCLDRPIIDAGNNAGPPQCTCSHPASPEPLGPEPWTGGYFSPRYQKFLRSGPSNEPYSHSCTAHSESPGEWIGEARRNLDENLANQASGSGVAVDETPPNETSSLPKSLERNRPSSGSWNDDAPIIQRDDAEGEKKNHDELVPVSGLDGPSEAVEPEAPRSGSQAHSGQRDNVENGGNSPTNVDGGTARGNNTGENTTGETTTGRNTTERGHEQAYTTRQALVFNSFQGLPRLPTLYPPHLPPPFHFQGQPTITTIHFFPPHEFPSIQYQHPLPVPHPPFAHYNPFIPQPQNSHVQAAHPPTSTLPEIPESNYFYPDGRPARLRFPTPPDQAVGQQQSSGNHEPAHATTTQNPANITQVTASQSALPGTTSGVYLTRPVEEEIVRLMAMFELLRDMHADLAQRLDSGRL